MAWGCLVLSLLVAGSVVMCVLYVSDISRVSFVRGLSFHLVSFDHVFLLLSFPLLRKRGEIIFRERHRKQMLQDKQVPDSKQCTETYNLFIIKYLFLSAII